MLFIKERYPTTDLSARATGVYLFLVALAVLLPRLPHIDSRVYCVDEAIFAVFANALADGGIPYRDATDHKPPMLFYFLAVLFRLFGWVGEKVVMHAALAAVVTLTALAVYSVASQAMNRRAGILAALLFALASFNQLPDDAFAFQTEWLMMAFVTAAMALALRWQRLGRKRDILLSGFVFGLAVFSKQPALIHGAVVFLYLCLSAVFSRASKRRYAEALSLFTAGAAVAPVFFTAYFASQGIFREFKYFFWDYNLMYSSVIPFKEKIQRGSSSVFGAGSLLVQNPLLSLPTAAFVAFPAPSMYFGGDPERRKSFILIFLWVLCSFAGLYLSGTGYFYYFIQVLPAFSVASGLVLAKAAESLQSRFPGNRAKTAAFAAAFAVTMFFYPVYFLWSGKATREFKWMSFPWFVKDARFANLPDFAQRVDARQLGDYLRANSTEDDRIFCWGFIPHIYLDSGRRPGTRFIICNFLVGMVLPTRMSPEFVMPGSWDILLKELEVSRPKFFIDSSVAGHYGFGRHTLHRYPRLNAWVTENYRKDRVVDMINSPSFVVWRRKDVPPDLALAGEPDGPAAAWPLNGNAYDATGNGHDALTVGALFKPGRREGGAYFDGLNDSLYLPSDLTLERGFSALFWAKPSKVRRWARFFEFSSRGAVTLYLARQGTGTSLYLDGVAGGDRSSGSVAAPDAIEDGRWQHFAVTMDSEGNAAIYKNAVLVARQRLSPPPAGAQGGTIGWGGTARDEFFEGMLDEFYLFERPLDPGEIVAWMNGGLKKGRS